MNVHLHCCFCCTHASFTGACSCIFVVVLSPVTFCCRVAEKCISKGLKQLKGNPSVYSNDLAAQFYTWQYLITYRHSSSLVCLISSRTLYFERRRFIKICAFEADVLSCRQKYRCGIQTLQLASYALHWLIVHNIIQFVVIGLINRCFGADWTFQHTVLVDWSHQ